MRDVYQKTLHPDLADDALVGISRYATLGLGLVALALAMTVAHFVEGRTVFWFVIFGWSGIAATFCPTMILSLFWKGMTRNGAVAAMVVGFVSVPLFKFGATALPGVGPYFAELAELPPAFLAGALAGVAVSLLDKRGRRSRRSRPRWRPRRGEWPSAQRGRPREDPAGPPEHRLRSGYSRAAGLARFAWDLATTSRPARRARVLCRARAVSSRQRPRLPPRTPSALPPRDGGAPPASSAGASSSTTSAAARRFNTT